MAQRICFRLEYNKASSDAVKLLMMMLMKPLFMPNKQRQRQSRCAIIWKKGREREMETKHLG